MGFYATDTHLPAPPPRTDPVRARQHAVCGQKTLRGPIHNAISGYRYYNPELGRWINRDPIGEGGHNLLKYYSYTVRENSDVLNELLNLYRYCANDSLSSIDPDGLAALEATIVMAIYLLLCSAEYSVAPTNEFEASNPHWEAGTGMANMCYTVGVIACTQVVVITVVQPAISYTKSALIARYASKLGSAPKTARFRFDASAGRYRDMTTGRFVSMRDLPWPSNRGFASSSQQIVGRGTAIDRYGSGTGRYAGQPGATVSQRGMAAGTESLPYTQYRVVKPLPAEVGPAAAVPDFGASGGARQYMFNKSLNQLVSEGFLEVVQ